jgi:hypothetical protein
MRIIIAVLLLSALSCASPSTGEGEGEGDGQEGEGEGDGQEGEGEGEPGPRYRCPAPAMVIADDSLDGTNWTATTVTTPTPLTLCNAWSEGASLEDEQVRKVRITIPAQAQRSLHRNVLEASQLDGVVIERGPFRAGRTEGGVCSGSATLSNWEPVTVGDTEGLNTEVRYDFGAGGVIVENIRVSANSDAVVIDGQYGVSSLVFVPPEGEAYATLLAPCTPTLANPRTVIEAVVGQADNGDDRVVYRVYRTQPVFAGSYDLDMMGIATFAMVDDFPTWATASGAFSQTYAADHHNWNDRSALFFDRDPINWHLTFRAGVRFDGEAVREVRFGGLNNFEDSFFDVTTTDLGTGADSSLRYTVPQNGQRLVSAQATAERAIEAGMACADGDVVVRGAGLLSSYSYALQLVTCDTAAGFVIIGVMPVAIPDVDLIGSLIGDLTDVIIDDAPGVQFTMGGTIHTLTIPAENLVVLNGATVSGPQYLPIGALEVDPTTTIVVADERLLFRGEGVELTIVRRWGAQGVGNSNIYAPMSARITWGEGQQASAAALDDMIYENTHHNWDDTLVARDGDVEFRWAATTNFNDPTCPEEDFLCNNVTVLRGDDVLLPTTRVLLVP